MIRRHAPSWSGLAFLSGLFALQCGLEGLGDGVRPSSPEGGAEAGAEVGDGHASPPDAGVPPADSSASPADAAHQTSDGSRPDDAFIVGLSEPDQLTMAAGFLYFTTGRDYEGAVRRCPIQGCQGEPEIIASGQTEPRGLTVTQTVIVGWVNRGAGQVMLASRGPGAASWESHALATEQSIPAGMAISAMDDAVWTNYGSQPDTAAVARRTGRQAPIIALSREKSYAGPILLSGEGKDVVWGHGNGLAETTLDADGHAPCNFVHSTAPVTNLASGMNEPLQLFWSTLDGFVLMANRPRAADALQHCKEIPPSEITSVVKGQGSIASFAVDPLYVYFSATEGGKGSLRRMRILGGEVEVLLDDLDDPRGVVVDGPDVYVAVRGDGTIRRIHLYI
ncbi:hypothetical protein LZC95_43120 [Pendulispora brunnea]|uniref:Lipoprotein n=1 Tax=Pendulispora brunnea TaxID=2905690 RepID=A0ABZ2K7A2_9BACT